jgi:hypothetical protein
MFNRIGRVNMKSTEWTIGQRSRRMALASLLGFAACGAPDDEGERADDRIEVSSQHLVSVHGLGWKRDTSGMMAGRLASLPAAPTAPPAAVDLSASFPPPGDQGTQGSCVGWAVGYAAKTYHEKLEEKWPLSASDHRFSPAWVYNQVNGGVDGGSSISTALGLLVSKGADVLGLFPYSQANFTAQPDAASLARAAHFKAASWNTVTVSEASFKSLLAAGTPVIAGLEIFPDFDLLDSSANAIYDTTAGVAPWRGCTTAPCDIGGHAITLVGYDDAVGAFRFINSWGTGWGSSGYGWIAYSFITNASIGMYAFVLNDATNAPGYMDSTKIWSVSSGI